MFSKVKKFLFKNTSTGQILAKNTFWLGFGEITSRVLKVFIIFYAIRVITVSEWGAFSYAISLCGLFMIFSDMGLSSILTRELSKDDTLKNKYISTSFVVKIILNLIIFLIVIFFAPLLSKNILSIEIIPIIALLMVFDSIRDFIFSINRAMEKMEMEAIVKIITNILLIIFTYIFLLQSRSIYSLAMGYMIGSLSGLVLTLIIFRKYLKDVVKNFSKDLVRPLLTIAWPFAFFAILGSIMSGTDTVMLGWIKDTTEIGFYATSQRVVAFMYIVPGLIVSSLLPTLTKQVEDKVKMKNILSYSLKVIYLFSIPVVLGGLILGDSLIVKLFTSEYIPTINIFKIAIVSILFTFPALVFNSVIFIFNRHKNIIRISLIGTTLNVIINIFLIPIYGGIGAAIATTVSQFIIMLLMKKELDKVIKLKMFSGLSKIILSSVLMSIFLFILKYMNINIWMSIILGVVMYFLVVFLLEEEVLLQFKKILKNNNT